MLQDTLFETQQALEDESRALGASRYRKQRSAAWTDALRPDVDEASLPPGRALLRRTLPATAQAIREFMESASSGRPGRRHTAIKLLTDAEPEALAYLTLRCAIQAGAQHLRLQRAALMVADAVRDHLQARRFEEANPAGAAGLEAQLRRRTTISRKRLNAIQDIYDKEGVSLNWSQPECLLVGSKLLELATDATGLFELVLIESGRGAHRQKQYKFQLTEKVDEWLERQHARCELLDPVPLPMVVRPRPWTTPTDGGYLTPPIGNTLVRVQTAAFHEDLASIDMPKVYSAVNHIQATPWKINGAILAVMRAAWASGGRIGKLPLADNMPLPGKPDEATATQADWDAWKAKAAKVHAAIARERSARYGFVQKLSVAEKFAAYPAIYFPHSIDFRGRVYPIPTGGPHPQDNDIGRALLMFAEGVPLGEDGGRWLTIHLANLFGIDKVSFAERIDWVERHREAILDSARDPLDGHRFWTEADKPWQALAACMEWAGYQAEGAAFRSRLPIALDGSNSGLQHYTALLRDPETAPHVNLTDRETPGDFYSLLAMHAQAVIDASTDPKAVPWREGRVIRHIVKRPCMTYVYAATRQGMARQIEEELEALDQESMSAGGEAYLKGADNGDAAFWLAGVLLDLLQTLAPAAKQVERWLRQIAKLYSKADLPIVWTAPSGLPVRQANPAMNAERTTVTFRGRKLQLQLSQPPAQRPWEADADTASPFFNAREAASSIAPNFIHSLDAAHLMAVAIACREEGINALAVIHDSFGTHAGHTSALARILRQTFLTQYSGNPLQAFYEEMKKGLSSNPKLQSQVPPPPSLGGFDLQEVLKAPYMFA